MFALAVKVAKVRYTPGPRISPASLLFSLPGCWPLGPVRCEAVADRRHTRRTLTVRAPRIGYTYCLCPCLCGGSAVSQIGEDLGGVDLCGVGLDNWFCWVFCEVLVIRNMRGMYRSKYNKEGNCIEDMLLADNCPVSFIRASFSAFGLRPCTPCTCDVDLMGRAICTMQGCALAQMEADLNAKGGGGAAEDSGVADMER